MIRYGACYEDDEGALLVVNQRSIAHFYDPQQGGSGIVTGPSSPDWMLSGAETATSGTNHYGWSDARNAFYNALTYRSVTSPNNALERGQYWATTFQSLGHIIHHLHDMAQPQHTRSDDHCDADRCRIPGKYKPSGYEKHLLNNRLEFVQGLAATASAPIMFGLPREFWNAVVPVDQPLSGAPNLQGHVPSTLGIAAYTASNFVSAGTDFVGGTTDGVTVWGQRADHPYPRAANELRPVSLAQLFADAAPSTLAGVARDLCEGDATTCYMQFLGTEADPLARSSALSNFGQALLRPSGAFSPPNISGGVGIFQQNFFTYDDAARKLVPRAVEYSAGLINYFFRGEMEISLPDEGIYGIVDHAVEKNKGSDGFRLIKLKLKNTTPDIATSNRGAIAQHMSNGEFRAVVKFRRNSCYLADLSGQIGSYVGTPAPANRDYASCVTGLDEIVVSDPEPVTHELLAGGPAQPMQFGFATPIPIEATDVFLQVVFKGALGEEQNAVAVTTRDISEPTFVSFINSNDYKVVDAQGSIQPIDYPGTTQAGQRVTTNDAGSWFAENGGWIGFSRLDPTVSTLKLPASGLAPGEFSRVALLLDIGQTAGALPLVDSALAGSTITGGSAAVSIPALAASDLPVWLYYGYTPRDSGLYPCSSTDPNSGQHSPCVEFNRISAASTQFDDSRNQAVVPSYWNLRGIIIARDQSGAAAGDRVVSALIERRHSFMYYPGVIEGARTDATLARYPNLPSLSPKPVSEIRFANAPRGRISQAAWEDSWLVSPGCNPADKPNTPSGACRLLTYYPVGNYPD